MTRIDQLFSTLRESGRKALMPFITAGDPDAAFTGDLLATLAEHGCDLIEVGIPYSDPIADGPVIQASYTRALDRGIRLDDIFEAVGRVAPRIPVPLVAMCSYAIVHRVGPERFIERAKSAGFSGAIVPDLMADEAGPLAAAGRERDFDLIQLVTPTTPRDRALRIAKVSRGFLYYVSVTGITGERSSLPPELADNVRWMRERTGLPICVGFGIATEDHVRTLAPVADGLIVGSALVRRIADASVRPRTEVLDEVGRFVDRLRAALDERPSEPRQCH